MDSRLVFLCAALFASLLGVSIDWSAPGSSEAGESRSDDDDHLPQICTDPSIRGDLCHRTMRVLYCELFSPVIFEGVWYSQEQAADACRQGWAPFYPDIGECLRFGPALFPLCLRQRGWTPEATDVFLAWQWRPEFVTGLGLEIQGLNYFVMDWRSSVAPDCWTEQRIAGAIVSGSPPRLHIRMHDENFNHQVGYEINCHGASVAYSQDRIVFECRGTQTDYTGFWVETDPYFGLQTLIRTWGDDETDLGTGAADD
jgi:hypothetical protein